MIQWRIVLVDITSQKEAGEALLKSEKRFRDLFENAPVAFQSLDGRGNVIAVNGTWLSLLAYAKAEVIGKNLIEFLHPDGKGHFKENFSRFKRIEGILGSEFFLRKKDGTDILLSFQGKIDRDSEGECIHTHCIFHDITAQRKTVYSEVDQGTTFNIYLPVSGQVPKREILVQDKLAKGTETVLLIDDEKMIIEVGKAMLERLGYHVIVAESGERAVERPGKRAIKLT